MNKIDHLYANKLISQYGSLLTQRQQEILNEYYGEDLSLSEIAENEAISRAAVSDLINRSLKQLLNYEDKLKLISKDQIINDLIQTMVANNDLRYIDTLNKLKEE